MSKKLVKLEKAANYGVGFADAMPFYKFTAAQRTFGAGVKVTSMELDGKTLMGLDDNDKAVIAPNMPGWAVWIIGMGITAMQGGMSTAYGRAFGVHCAQNVQKFSEQIGPIIASEKELVYGWSDYQVYTTPKAVFEIALNMAAIALTTQENMPHVEVIEKVSKKEIVKLTDGLF